MSKDRRIEELEQEITDGALSRAEQVNGLAERIERLEADLKRWRHRCQAADLENGQLKTQWAEQQKQAEELEAENERLRKQVDQLDAYITYRDYDRKILDENRRLKEENRQLRATLRRAKDFWPDLPANF